MTVRIIHISRPVIGRVLIQWEDPDGTSPWRIQRSATGLSDWETVGEADSPFYVDTTRDERFHAMSAYRVASVADEASPLVWSVPVDTWGNPVVTPTLAPQIGAQRRYDAPANVDGPRPLFYGQAKIIQSIANMRAARWEAQVRTFFGTQVTFLKRRRWGPRCPRCFHNKAGATINGNCTTCYSTGYDGGFWTPLCVPAKINADAPTQAQATDAGKIVQQSLRVSLGPFPIVEDEDVIVDHDRARFYRIRGVDAETVAGRRYGYKCGLIELGPTHIISKFPLGDQTRHLYEREAP